MSWKWMNAWMKVNEVYFFDTVFISGLILKLGFIGSVIWLLLY